MKASIEQLDLLDIRNRFPIGDLVVGWHFRVREVSAGCYSAEGTDLFGRTVSHQGTDHAAVLGEAVGSARVLAAKSQAT